MSNAREIQTRVSSIKNTQKVTKAMEMVSAAKMQRAIKEVLNIRPYAHGTWSVLMNLSRSLDLQRHVLLKKRPVRRILLILIASNRGLCGSFNARISKQFVSYIRNKESLARMSGAHSKGEEQFVPNIDVIAVGKKAEKMAVMNGIELKASFPDLMHVPRFETARDVAELALRGFAEKTYDKVSAIYTDYISPMTQEVKIRQILPLDSIEFEKQLAEMDIHANEFGLSQKTFEYKVEPSPEQVLNMLIPSLIRTMIYHMALESNASKEACRMVAMKNATDSAGEIAEDLTLAYNRIRQAKITQEIAEISAGRLALEG